MLENSLPFLNIYNKLKTMKKQMLSEQFKRMQKLAGIVEVSNPYSVTWLEPTDTYFKQELDELTGNDMRFSKEEFFNPQNYDKVYSLLPHTFKMIAEHSKGSEIQNPKEIKETLLNKEISDLMDDWDNFRKILIKDTTSQNEVINLFKKGKEEEWDNEKISNTYYMGKLTTHSKIKNTTSSGLIKQMGDDPNMQGYKKNVQDFKNKKHIELPLPFVLRLPSGGREGKEYTLIGGHKRSTIAAQLGLQISVWFIDLQ